MNNGKYFLVALFFVLPIIVFSQQTIKGIVYFDSIPVSEAVVWIAGLKDAVETDSSGIYKIEYPTSYPDTIICTYSSQLKTEVIETKSDTIFNFYFDIYEPEIVRSFMQIYTISDIFHAPYNLGAGLNFFTGERSSIYTTYDYSTDFKNNYKHFGRISFGLHTKKYNYHSFSLIHKRFEIDTTNFIRNIGGYNIYFNQRGIGFKFNYGSNKNFSDDNYNSSFLFGIQKSLRIRYRFYTSVMAGVEYYDKFYFQGSVSLPFIRGSELFIYYNNFLGINSIQIGIINNFYGSPKRWPFTLKK